MLLDVVVAHVHRHWLMAEQELQETSHRPSFPCRVSSSPSRRSMVLVVSRCCRRSGPSWFRRSRLLASIASWFITLQLVELVIQVVGELVCILLHGLLIPGGRQVPYLHGEAVVEQRGQKTTALEHHEGLRVVDVQVVVHGSLGEEADPSVLVGQGDVFTSDGYFNFHPSSFRLVWSRWHFS